MSIADTTSSDSPKRPRRFPECEAAWAFGATKVSEIMTSDVVSVRPDTPRRAVARLLLEKSISAVPVVDAEGVPVGMVSEGDLIGRDDSARDACRDWWLALLAEGEELNPEFLARRARDIEFPSAVAALRRAVGVSARYSSVRPPCLSRIKG